MQVYVQLLAPHQISQSRRPHAPGAIRPSSPQPGAGESLLSGSRRAIEGTQRWGHYEHLRKRDPCGKHGCESGAVDGDSGDVGVGDCEGEEGEGGALRGEGQEPKEDWVSDEVIKRPSHKPI